MTQGHLTCVENVTDGRCCKRCWTCVVNMTLLDVCYGVSCCVQYANNANVCGLPADMNFCPL